MNKNQDELDNGINLNKSDMNSKKTMISKIDSLLKKIMKIQS